METFLRLRDYKVHAQIIGDLRSDAPVLVFLHEALGSIIQWKQFPEDCHRLTSLPCIVIERRGHGQSDPLTAARTAAYLHEYTDELHFILSELLPADKKVILIGHSDGGTIALLYARYYPRLVAAVCTMAAHTFVEKETLAGIAPAVSAYEQGKLDGLRKIHGDKTDALFYAWANTWQSPEFATWDIRAEIVPISCPVLVIQGADDQYGTVQQVISIENAAVSHERCWMPHCGHHPHLEKRTDTLKALYSFIRKLTGQKGQC